MFVCFCFSVYVFRFDELDFEIRKKNDDDEQEKKIESAKWLHIGSRKYKNKEKKSKI